MIINCCNILKISNITCVAALLCLASAISSCNKGKNDWSDSTADGVHSLSYNNAEDAIADMDKIDWESPEIYNQVLDEFINGRKSLKETDRHALRSSLDEAYSKQLLRTCTNILASDCSSRHSTLNAAYKELQARGSDGYVPEGIPEMEKAYARHNEQLQFAVSSSYGVGLSSFLDSYNSSYDSQKRSEAQAIRATNPTCREIQNKVSEAHVNEVLAQRKQNYYAALASKFCATSSPSIGDYNRLRSLLQSAKNSQALINKIEAHWDRVQESSDYDY